MEAVGFVGRLRRHHGGASLRASDYEVRPINGRGSPWQFAKQFIAEHHYSRGCAKTSVYVHGLYRRDSQELLGVAMWLPPTKAAAVSVNRLDWRLVLSLSRLVVHPDVPKNGATFLMSRSIRLIRQEDRFVSLVTYADEFMNHTGAIYLASNWTFVGTSEPKPRWEDEQGRQVSNRATTTKTHDQMRYRGCRLVGYFRKRKFVLHLRRPRDDRPLRFWLALAA